MTTKSNSSVRSYHALYSTSIACSSGGRDPGKLARLHPTLRPDTSTAQELAHFVYPDHVLSQPDLCLRHGILAPTNVQVDEYHRYMLTRLTGTERVYLATDTLKEADDVELQIFTS
ncbi:ATP-dependent DNA helicase [Pleurotus pulmonarius]